MSRTFDHDRLTAAQFSAALDQAGLTPTAFEFLTGASRTSVVAWLKPEGHPRSQEPPFWVTSWLGLYLLPGAPERAQAIADSKLIGGDDDQD